MKFLQPINLQDKLSSERKKSFKHQDVLNWVENILNSKETANQLIFKRLKSTSQNTITNTFNIDEVNADAIYHISEIKKICIDYRLRFLDTRFFKDEYPKEAIEKIHQLEKKHNTILNGFKIIAPIDVFKLRKADDPLLFAPMGNGYYHLIHKWGNDMHPFRKLKYWAIKNIENLLISIAILSVVLTAISYPIFFTKSPNFGYLLMIAMFYFKGIIGLVFILNGSSGKNFSEYSWQSQYDKIS